jgi:hypothetical protein
MYSLFDSQYFGTKCHVVIILARSERESHCICSKCPPSAAKQRRCRRTAERIRLSVCPVWWLHSKRVHFFGPLCSSRNCRCIIWSCSLARLAVHMKPWKENNMEIFSINSLSCLFRFPFTFSGDQCSRFLRNFLTFYQATRRRIPQDSNLHIHSREQYFFCVSLKELY